ncbi:E3 ubiquitin-protein ligase TRIM39-like isoform X23 [Erpetoichthys calabaricus]|uniref:E3 ubiquitin-protein ligase TRIM39-like isoform X23 n=1 Tax=Erpetoichthys calabaricus TaxID=27687 RepID=UPI00223475F6|nr:E3 ubiquitin-protein ligase TRIM39-like isoform X23 [Erpetoichthys calabaricus]
MTPKDYLLKLPESFTVTSIISALFKCVRSTITCTLSIPGKCVRLPESFTVTSIISALFKCVRSTITCTLSIPGKCVRELNHYNQDAEEILRRYNAEGYIVQREWNEMLTCQDVKETLGRHTSLLLQLLFDVREILGKYISLLRQRLNDVKETLWIFFSLLLHPQNDVREILGKYISLFRQRPNASLLLQLLFDVREILGKYISLLYQRQNDPERFTLDTEWNEMLTSQDIETVDRNTAHGDLHVSEDNKRISFQGNVKCPGGRAEWPCALAKELESGKHCWILEVGEKSSWAVGVASETILKNLSIPDSCKEGYWYIKLFKRKKFQAFSSSTTDLSQKPRKIAVYLDFDMGELSFVDVEKHVVIHRFKEQFSDKLYPVFSPGIHDKGPLILHSIPQNKTN